MKSSTKKNTKVKAFSTTAIHTGSHPDKETGAIMPPIFMTSTFVQTSPGEHKGYEYSRSHNPTRTRLEENLAALEKGKYALVTATGMAACNLILQSLKHNSRILCGDDVYGGTYRILANVFHEIHHTDRVDMTNISEVEAALKTHKYDLIWLESPTNPLLKISDIRKITALAKKYKARTVVDNTFMSPYFQNPLLLGADLVLHSMTKYINGHSDALGGVIITNDKTWYDKIWYLQNATGPSQSPFESWLILRSIKTLAIRMEAHQKNAFLVANFLEKHPKVETVYYPGLKSHPGHKIAKSQMSGFGGMISFTIKGTLKDAKSFLKKLHLFALAESLGGVESLVEHPAIMTHASIPKAERERIGISDTLIRISVGLEDSNDLINELSLALK